MIWLTWRQHRIEGLVTLALLAASGVFLLVTGLSIARTLQGSGLGACLASHPNDPDLGSCWSLTGPFFQEFDRFKSFVFALLLIPMLLGALVGAPLVAREYERRTNLLVWMQSVSRTRWLAIKLLLVLGAGALVGVVLLIMLARWYRPMSQFTSTLGTLAFDFSGPVLIASTVMALALGVAMGALTRRTVMAIVLTLALLVAIRLPVEGRLRPHYQPPIMLTSPLVEGNDVRWPLRRDDWFIDSGYLGPQGEQTTIVQCPSTNAVQTGDLEECLRAGGYRGYYLAYQPADRFWTFQWIETGIYLAISALALALTFWLVRRRLS